MWTVKPFSNGDNTLLRTWYASFQHNKIVLNNAVVRDAALTVTNCLLAGSASVNTVDSSVPESI